MKIICPRCNTSYNIPSNKIPQEKRATITCKNCGGKIIIEPSAGKQPDNGAHAEPISTPTISPTGKAPPQITETDFINFIGKNSHKYVPKFTWFNIKGVDKFSITWHWPAFFVGAWWMLYRKRYLWALVAFLLNFIPFINLLARIAWGMTGNYIYYKHSKRKILKVKASQPPSISISLREIGGVNGWVPIVAPILVVGMLLAVPIYQVHHYRMRSYNFAARSELKNSSIAQDAYFFDNMTYADSIKKLIGRKYGLYPSKWVTVYVIDADENHYMMESFHNKGNKKYIVMGPEREIREISRDRAWAKKADYDQATADFTKALEINPRDASGYYSRGLAWGKRAKWDQAIADYTKALEIKPRHANAYFNRGRAWDKKGGYDQAIADYTKAIEIYPGNYRIYVNRGNAYIKKDHYDQAIADYTKAIELNPRDAKTTFNRAIAYYFRREYKKAWDDVHKAQNLGYKFPPIFLKKLRKASGRQR